LPLPADISEYNSKLSKPEQQAAAQLCELISAMVPEALGKVWHGHPVWFLDGNPIVGYSTKKAGLELLFWSGQSFVTPCLKPVGKFKAAGLLVTPAELDSSLIRSLLGDAIAIQWDYQNLPKNPSLEKLTKF
jgi:hypothetical protein